MTESPRWFKSSRSKGKDDCVEIAANLITSNGVVPVRDSKNPTGPQLAISAGAFASFVQAIKMNDL